MSFNGSELHLKDKAGNQSLQYPIGMYPDGTIMFCATHEVPSNVLSSEYKSLKELSLPVTCIYQLVTILELTFGALCRSVVQTFPRILGDKRQISLATVLGCDSIEAAHFVATEQYIRELAYLGPKDQATELEKILGVDLMNLPALWTYLEVKATRDIWVHNGGFANEIYVRKAGAHARAAKGQLLPVGTNYFLAGHEAAFQLVEHLRKELMLKWPMSQPALPPPTVEGAPGQAAPS